MRTDRHWTCSGGAFSPQPGIIQGEQQAVAVLADVRQARIQDGVEPHGDDETLALEEAVDSPLVLGASCLGAGDVLQAGLAGAGQRRLQRVHRLLDGGPLRRVVERWGRRSAEAGESFGPGLWTCEDQTESAPMRHRFDGRRDEKVGHE